MKQQVVVIVAFLGSNLDAVYISPLPVSVSAAVNFDDNYYGNQQYLINQPTSFNQDKNQVEFPKIRSHPTGFENPYRVFTPIHEPSQE